MESNFIYKKIVSIEFHSGSGFHAYCSIFLFIILLFKAENAHLENIYVTAHTFKCYSIVMNTRIVAED